MYQTASVVDDGNIACQASLPIKILTIAWTFKKTQSTCPGADSVWGGMVTLLRSLYSFLGEITESIVLLLLPMISAIFVYQGLKSGLAKSLRCKDESLHRIHPLWLCIAGVLTGAAYLWLVLKLLHMFGD